MAGVFLQLEELMRQVPGAELNPDLRAMLFVAHVMKIEDKSGYGMRAEWVWHCTTVRGVQCTLVLVTAYYTLCVSQT